ncbi:MAG TPA: hypothetical protein VLM80_06160 [Anaerolineales bacterium]|nr:hypothetical protein [Anaerolineales bacterium]
MSRNALHRLALIFFITSFFSACSFPGAGPDIEATQFESTLQAELTLKAPTVTRIPTKTPRPTPTNTQPPTDTPIPPTPIPSATPETIYMDDFVNSRGWPSTEQDNFAFGIDQGAYYIFVNYPNAAIWSIRYEDHADVRLQTHAQRVKGPETGYYGVVCRFVDASNYYIMVIAEDGFFGIGKMFAGTLTFIEEGLDEAGIIHRGDFPNQVEGDCLGNTMSLVVNGQTLLQVEDSTHKQGKIGLVTGAKIGYGVRVNFDDFLVLKP